MSSFDIESPDEVTERNELCPEGVKEPDVVTEKNRFGELYEKWIEMRSVYKCLTLILLIIEILAFAWLINDLNQSKKKQNKIIELERQILSLEGSILEQEQNIILEIKELKGIVTNPK